MHCVCLSAYLVLCDWADSCHSRLPESLWILSYRNGHAFDKRMLARARTHTHVSVENREYHRRSSALCFRVRIGPMQTRASAAWNWDVTNKTIIAFGWSAPETLPFLLFFTFSCFICDFGIWLEHSLVGAREISCGSRLDRVRRSIDSRPAIAETTDEWNLGTARLCLVHTMATALEVCS